MNLRIPNFVLCLALGATFLACEKDGEVEDDSTAQSNTTNTTNTTTPTANLGSSHNTGKNCLACHRFSVGGSVYKKDLTSTYPGSVVKLTTQPNGAGTVVATMTTDKSGNIRLSSSISFGSGLYVGITGSAGTQYMKAAITSGGCNACHGNTTSRAWTE